MKVYPGVYIEQVNISTDIVVQGSGYEYTQIVSNNDQAISMSSGKVIWFAIPTNTGRQDAMSEGTLTNCVVWDCTKYGLDATSETTAIIENCVW